MNKTILTLAALATIGTAALAPTSASAFGLHLGGLNIKLPSMTKNLTKVLNTNVTKVVRQQNIGKDIKLAIKIGERVAVKALKVEHAGYHPVWKRPVFVRHFGYPAPVYQAPVRIASAAPAYRPAMQAPVNGMNVTMVAVPNGQYSMSGEGQWIEQNADGKTFQFVEANRDQSSVTLTDASRGIELTLDLGQREVFYADKSGKRPLYPIVQVSAK